MSDDVEPGEELATAAASEPANRKNRSSSAAQTLYGSSAVDCATSPIKRLPTRHFRRRVSQSWAIKSGAAALWSVRNPTRQLEEPDEIRGGK